MEVFWSVGLGALQQRNHGSHATDVEKATQGHKEKDSINIQHRK